MKALFAISLFALAGCSTLGQGPTTLSGSWGGPGIGLVLEGGLGAVDYDCASGTIDQPIHPPRSIHRHGDTPDRSVGADPHRADLHVASRDITPDLRSSRT